MIKYAYGTMKTKKNSNFANDFIQKFLFRETTQSIYFTNTCIAKTNYYQRISLI